MVGDPGPDRPTAAPSTIERAALASSLLDWYDLHGRDLAIRRLSDPYAIWVAETMSQQTQIVRVGEAVPDFLAAFPDVGALAGASAGELLRAWGGLGYPRRALALREAARVIVARFAGQVPRGVPDLEDLPGVGPYTARAVAATAYGVPVTALDVNARRVLARVTGSSAEEAATRVFGVFADGLAPSDRAADWNHALMDLGSTVCRVAPDCAACPLRIGCAHAASRAAATPAAVAAGSSPSGRIRPVDPGRAVPQHQPVCARSRAREPARPAARDLAHHRSG